VNPEHLDAEASAKTLRRIFSDPVTWTPFLPAAAAFAFLGAPWWGSLLVLAGVATPIGLWWRKQWPGLYGKERVDSLRASFSEENGQLGARLVELEGKLRLIEERDAADRIRALLPVKTAIEAVILRDQAVTSEEAEIAKMVSGLVNTIAEEGERLVVQGANEEEQERLRTDIANGARVLDQTHREIDTLIDPLSGLAPTSPENAIREKSDRLQARLNQARKIRRRLEHDLDPPTGPKPLSQ